MRFLKHLAVAGCAAVIATAMAGPSMAQTLRVGTIQVAPLGLDGYCGELMARIAEVAGLQFEYRAMELPQLLPALVASEIDIYCAFSQGTVARRQDMGLAHTSATFVNNEGMFVLGTDTTAYTSFADLRGQPVGVNEGSAAFRAVLVAAGVDVRLFPSDTAALAALRAGEVKAIIRSAGALRYQMDVLGQNTDLRFVDTYVSEVNQLAALTVRNTDILLLGQLQAALERLKGDGTVAQLTTKWGLAPPPDL